MDELLSASLASFKCFEFIVFILLGREAGLGLEVCSVSSCLSKLCCNTLFFAIYAHQHLDTFIVIILAILELVVSALRVTLTQVA